jgi:hypothetical protein
MGAGQKPAETQPDSVGEGGKPDPMRGLLCMPGLSAGKALAAGAAYARGRRAFFLSDPAGSRAATLEAVRAIRPGDSGHTAMYVPRLRVPDPL